MAADDARTERDVVVRGVRIHYVERGTGAPVLFVHGNPTSSYLWRNITPAIARTHRTIAIDLPGFGGSEHPLGFGYRFDDHAAVLEAFIGELGLEGVALVLHDWGGILGMYYAVRHPERVTNVVLMSTSVAPVRMSPVVGALLRLPRAPLLGWLIVQRLNLFLPLALRAGVVHWSHLTPEVRRAYARPFPDAASRLPIRRWTEQLPARPGDRVSAVLREIGEALPAFDRPVLIVKAQRDPILSTSRARALLDVLPHARLELVRDAGHFLQEDQPERVAELLADFLASPAAAGDAPAGA